MLEFTISTEKLNRIKNVLDSTEKLYQLRVKQLKLLEELSLSVLQHRVVDASGDLRLDPIPFKKLRIIFRAVVSPTYANGGNFNGLGTNFERYSRKYRLTVDGDNFTFQFTADTAAVTLSVTTARCLIRYGIRKGLLSLEYRTTDWAAHPSLYTWEEPGYVSEKTK